MKTLHEILRLFTIAVVSPAIGFGALLFLDGFRIIKPGDMDKGLFLLVGFAVAIAIGLFLMRTWPSPIAAEKTTSAKIELD